VIINSRHFSEENTAFMGPFIQMQNITKSFSDLVANNHVTLEVNKGEIHALLGENGAGKSTLMNILYGLYCKDEGEIFIDGKQVSINNPKDAINLGIGMVHQEFMLIPRFSVIENIIISSNEENNSQLLDYSKVTNRINKLSKQYGLDIDPLSLVESLSVGEQQRVEILKLLYRDANILILDEPTGVLTSQECEALFLVLKSLAKHGHTIIFITHKLHEIVQIADRVTIMRDGSVVSTQSTKNVNRRELARMMVGREIVFDMNKKVLTRGKLVLKIKDLYTQNEAGNPKLKGINLDIYEHEIVGIAGVDGNGQTDLAEAIMNLCQIKNGSVFVNNTNLTEDTPANHRSAGIMYVPSDRRNVGSVGALSVAKNSILGNLINFLMAGKLLLNDNAIHKHALDLIDCFDVRTDTINTKVQNLSGGNAQKLILGRELLRLPKLLIAEQPTRGLDVGATEYIRQKLLAERERGVAILLISTELEEILQLSDRIAVIYKGEIMGVLDADNVDIETIGLMMAGTHLEKVKDL
jgi:general nucleoside transport system ATP-binding protein